MLSLRTFVVSVTFFVLWAMHTQAQTLNVYGVNSTMFPRVTADYVAFDALGVPITDLTATDFRVTETPVGGSALDLSATVSHSCVDLGVDPEASIIIILDRSQSMNDDVVGGKKRWEYAKDAVRAFVNRVKFVGQTRVSVVTFAGSYQVVNEWVDNAQPILDSLVNLQWQTVTNYVLPFEHVGNNIYDLFKKRPASVPKYCFFLTDGHPNPAITDEIKFVRDNSLKLQSQAIRFFSVTIFEETTHMVLDALSRATGGKSIVTNEQGVVDLFSYLALETQAKKSCQITWIAPYTCNEQGQLRNVAITMRRGSNPTANSQYLAPPKSVAKADVSNPVLFCGDPPPNNSSFANVTITAQNATMAVTSFNIVPSTYFRVVDWNFPLNQGAFASFNLAPNAKRVIRVEFTQGASQAFRQALLSLGGLPCPPNITLVGGTGVVLLTSPIGGELYSTCDTVTIKWAGVLPTQPVAISYSLNSGATWIPIDGAATGLSYKWLPPVAGLAYKIRVSVTPAPQLVWAKRMGGSGRETATSVAVEASGLKVYATGYFDGPSQFGPVSSANLAGNIDGYVIEMDADGIITGVLLLTGTASNDERIIGVVTDNLGNWYVAGYYSSPTAQLGASGLMRSALDTRNMFVNKYAGNGSLQWSHTGRGTAIQSSWSDATNIGIRYDVLGNPEIIVAGNFQRYIEVGLSRSGTMERGGPYPTATLRPYYVRYDSGGFPSLTVNATPPTNAVYRSKTVTDNLGFAYETDAYSGPKSFTTPPPITLPNLGQTDVFVSKIGAPPATSDSSKTVFSAKSPSLAFTIAKVVFPATPLGKDVPRSLPSALRNTGDFAVTIQALNFVGVNGADFRLAGSLVGTRIDPGKSVSLEIIFEPKGVGARTGLLEVVGNCSATAQLLLEGTGLAPCVWESQSSVNLGKVPLAQPGPYPVSCVLKNTGPLVLSGNLSVVTSDPDITVTNLGPFVLPANGGCFDLQLLIAAATPGVKTIVLAFGIPVDCGAASTTVTVEIVEPSVAIDSTDFGRVRILTPVTGTITIENLNPDPARITSFSLSNPANLNFQITLPPAPQTLNPGAKIIIPVTYTPQTRGAHAINVLGTVQGQTTQLIGEAKGFGFLPTVVATGYSFNTWTVGSTSPESTGKVVVRNTDAESSLRIEAVAFETPSASFAWTNALPTFPITLGPGSAPLEIPVSFTPQVVGTNQVRVRITHDARPGPSLSPVADTLVIVSGEGIDPSDIPPIIFSPTLTCASRIESFLIVNPSPQFPLNVQAPTPSGDVAMFSIDQTTAFVIPAGQSKIIRITFAPPAVGMYSASYQFDNDQNLRLNVTVSGQGITTPVDFRYSNVVTGTVGQSVAMPVTLAFNVGQYVGVTPTEFRFAFTHDPNLVRFNTIVLPQLAGWTFIPTIGVGRVDIVATTIAAPLVAGNFFTPTFDIYLNAADALPVMMSVMSPLSCLIVSGDSSAIKMIPICYAAGRLVTISSQRFTLKEPKKNPVQDELVVEYSTGFSVAAQFQIVSAVGDIVYDATTPVGPSGVYSFEANVRNLSTGVYFLRMRSGPYAATKTFMIVR